MKAVTNEYNIYQDDLFFKRIVDSYISNPRFLNRAWLISEIEKCLKDVERRFLLITGVPGIGKSALIAKLSHSHPNWLVYFIRRDQRTSLGDVDAKSFLLHIGYQLAALYPKLFEPESVKLVVEQKIGTVDKSGEIVAAEVKKILASPFYQNIVEIRQKIERNMGNVTGLRIDELIIEPRLISLNDLQNMALFDPANLMLNKYPKEKIVILIDALDELRYHNVNHTLLNWLTNCPNIPSNVNFVLTSRPPDDALRTFCDKKTIYLKEFVISTEDPRIQADLKAYVELLVAEKDVAPIIKGTKRGIAGFTMEAVNKASGNIGYLDALARGIDHALRVKDIKTLRELLSLHDLPDDIEQLYTFFIRQIKTTVEKQIVKVEDLKNGNIYNVPMWSAVYKPILSILAVALEPLTLSQIKSLGNIKVDWDYFIEAVNKLSQFLEKFDDHYRLYHSTIPEFLTNNRLKKSLESASFYVDPNDARSRIVSFYKGKALDWNEVDWSKVDEYGLSNIAAHLYELRNTDSYQFELYRLICENFMKIKKKKFLSHHSFVRDLLLALEVARAEDPPNLLQEVRCCLLYSICVSLYSKILPELLGVLAQFGEHEKAMRLAALLNDARQQCKAYLLIGKALIKLNKSAKAIIPLEHAVSAVHDIWKDPVEEEHRTREKFAWLSGVDDNVFDIMEADKPVLEKRWSKENALSDVAGALVHAGEPNRAVEVSKMIEKSIRGHTLKIIVEILANKGQFDLALEIANEMEDDFYKDDAIASTAFEMFNNGKLDSALNLIKNINSQSQQIESFKDFAKKFIEENKFEMAITLAKKIIYSDERGRNEYLAGLVSSLAFKGRFGRALNLAEEIESNYYSEYAKTSVAIALAKSGNIEPAKNLIGEIKKANRLIIPLCYLAKAYEKAGKRREAKIKAKEAFFLTKKMSYDDNQSHAFCSLAETFACIGDLVRAEKCSKKALIAAGNIDISWVRVFDLDEVAEILVEIIQFEKSIEMVNELRYNYDKVYILCSIAKKLFQIGKFKKAAVAAKKAFSMAENTTETSLSVQAWAKVAESNEIIAAIEEIEDLEHKASALTSLAQELANNGEHIKASKIANRVIEITEMKKRDSSIDRLSHNVSVALAQEKKFDWAISVMKKSNHHVDESSEVIDQIEILIQKGSYEEALNLAVKIENELEKIEALSEISVKMNEKGHEKKASKVAKKAFRFAEQVRCKNPRMYAQAIKPVVQALIKTKRPELNEVVSNLVTMQSMFLGRESYWSLARITKTLDQEGMPKLVLEMADIMVSNKHCRREDLQLAAKTFINTKNIKKAIAISKKIKNSEHLLLSTDEKVRSLLYIAECLIQKGFKERAKELIDYVVKIKENILIYDYNYLDVAKYLYQIGHYDRILTSLVTMNDEKEKAQILSSIAKELSFIGEKQRAREIARQAFEIIPKEVHCYSQYDSPYSVAEEEMTKHLIGFASNLVPAGELSLALEAIGLVEDEEEREKATRDIAGQLTYLGFFDDALNIANNLKHGKFKTHSLNFIAESMAEAGRREIALSTWKTAINLAKDLGQKEVLKTLGRGAMIIASIDGGQILWDIYKSVLEIESWWNHNSDG
jgi:tetratricopeptide (TPR) repeat protein